jgi:hypothetical protein
MRMGTNISVNWPSNHSFLSILTGMNYPQATGSIVGITAMVI